MRDFPTVAAATSADTEDAPFVEQSAKTKGKPEALKPRLWHLGALIGEAVTDASEAHEARKTRKPRGPITGLTRLDCEIGGTLPKDALTMILGNSGTGKTALAGQIAANCGFPAVYMTTEMSPVELLRRHTARVTSTFLGKLKTGELAPTEVEQLLCLATEKLTQLTILDATIAYATESHLREVMVAAKGDAKHAVLVIDSLHTWARGSGVGASEYDSLNEHLTALVRLSKQARCSIIIICEQNRFSLKEGGGINSGAGTRFIEYSADLILDLDAKAPADGGGEKAITLMVAKNRNGSPDKPIKLNFNGALQRFEEVER